MVCPMHLSLVLNVNSTMLKQINMLKADFSSPVKEMKMTVKQMGNSEHRSIVLQVDIVDPLKLTQEFGNILANPIIATHVEATFIVHKGL